MKKIISVHEYTLKKGVPMADFESAIREAERRSLFDLPGLKSHHFLKGIRGKRTNQAAAIWIYESRDAWEKLWGREDDPKPKEKYPETWRKWENEILKPLLDRDPDRINFTTYEESI